MKRAFLFFLLFFSLFIYFFYFIFLQQQGRSESRSRILVPCWRPAGDFYFLLFLLFVTVTFYNSNSNINFNFNFNCNKFLLQTALISPQISELTNSLANLKWGFRKRESELLSQIEQFRNMTHKLHSSQKRLRSSLR